MKFTHFYIKNNRKFLFLVLIKMTEKITMEGMTMAEKEHIMIKELETIKSEFYRNNFEKGMKYMYNHNFYTYYGKMKRIYEKCLKLKKEMDEQM